MQIALTKKLASAMGLLLEPDPEVINPLFVWTANWAKVWDNRKTEDMLVLINNATRFCVAVYQVKKKDMKDVDEDTFVNAIRHTLLALNLNPEVVDEYLRQAGDIVFGLNADRQMTTFVNRAGIDAAFFAGPNYGRDAKVYVDTIGAELNLRPVSAGTPAVRDIEPRKAFFDAITALTDKSAYDYRAFELLVTLDLEICKATRRLIVPADITFAKLHGVLQQVFDWKNYHLHTFDVYDGKNREPVAALVMDEESLEFAPNGVLEARHKLSEFFPKDKSIVYTYDIGDNWGHEIELVRVIENHNADSPFLLEAVGQTPPEDVGGVGEFIDFREIMLNPQDDSYAETKEWAGYWKPELNEWQARPREVRGKF